MSGCRAIRCFETSGILPSYDLKKACKEQGYKDNGTKVISNSLKNVAFELNTIY